MPLSTAALVLDLGASVCCVCVLWNVLTVPIEDGGRASGPAGPAKQLTLPMYGAVAAVFLVGLVLMVVAIVYTLIEEELYVPIIVFPLGFGALVLSMMLYGVFSFPHKVHQFYQWK